MGTVVNHALSGVSLEITLTVPFTLNHSSVRKQKKFMDYMDYMDSTKRVDQSGQPRMTFNRLFSSLNPLVSILTFEITLDLVDLVYEN